MLDLTFMNSVPEQIPKVQPLHIHEVMIDQNKITDRDNERDNHCNNWIIQCAHFNLLLYEPGSSVDQTAQPAPRQLIQPSTQQGHWIPANQ
jgi:hypothetical protein